MTYLTSEVRLLRLINVLTYLCVMIGTGPSIHREYPPRDGRFSPLVAEAHHQQRRVLRAESVPLGHRRGGRVRLPGAVFTLISARLWSNRCCPPCSSHEERKSATD